MCWKCGYVGGVLEGCWRVCVRGCVCWRGGCVVGVGVNV